MERFSRLKYLSTTLGLLLCCAAVNGNDQQCDINTSVYENLSSVGMVVTMDFTDGCPDADSIVEVYPRSVPPKPMYVKDMTSKAFTLSVPASGKIMFNCRGKGAGHGSTGGCSWRLISASPQ